MVAKTPLKPAFSPPSLHKMEKICSDGICHGRPDLASDQTSRLDSMIYIGHGISLVLDLNIKLESRQAIQIRPGEEIRHRRVTQCTELQVVTQDACLPSHA